MSDDALLNVIVSSFICDKFFGGCFCFEFDVWKLVCALGLSSWLFLLAIITVQYSTTAEKLVLVEGYFSLP